MLTLRPYQYEAKHAVYDHLRARDDNPCVVIPTAGGKTPVMASICQDAVGLWQGRVMILAHVKELLEQTADKLHAVCPEVRFGVYSAGLKRRDRAHAVIVAGIQSVYQRACDFDPFDLVVIDEAHMIPPDGDGMYRQFLADAKTVNPHLRIVGFTATPFRLKTGSICTPDGFLNHVCYEVGVRELIVQGYLCPLVTKAGINKPDVDRLHVRGGEYVAGEVEDLMDQDNLVEAACGEIVGYTGNRNAVLIFARGGYIVAPPSVVEDKTYHWAPGLELDDAPTRLPEPPAWLAADLDRLANGSPTLAPLPPLAVESEPDANAIPSGQRNATMARLAGATRRVGMSRSELTAALLRVNQDRCVPPLATREVERIATSIARYPPDDVSVALGREPLRPDAGDRRGRSRTDAPRPRADP